MSRGWRSSTRQFCFAERSRGPTNRISHWRVLTLCCKLRRLSRPTSAGVVNGCTANSGGGAGEREARGRVTKRRTTGGRARECSCEKRLERACRGEVESKAQCSGPPGPPPKPAYEPLPPLLPPPRPPPPPPEELAPETRRSCLSRSCEEVRDRSGGAREGGEGGRRAGKTSTRERNRRVCQHSVMKGGSGVE